MEWLKFYIEDVIEELVVGGVKDLLVVFISFVFEYIEIL